jgi:hypothetical protein
MAAIEHDGMLANHQVAAKWAKDQGARHDLSAATSSALTMRFGITVAGAQGGTERRRGRAGRAAIISKVGASGLDE